MKLLIHSVLIKMFLLKFCKECNIHVYNCISKRGEGELYLSGTCERDFVDLGVSRDVLTTGLAITRNNIYNAWWETGLKLIK